MGAAFVAVGLGVLALARGSPAWAILCVLAAILALLASDRKYRL
jgi:hypothetical protein